jgi:hypothetical protein
MPQEKGPQLWRNNYWFLHHNNVPVNALLLICDFLANMNTTVLPWPPYSSDLALADFFLISQTEINFERMNIDESRDYGKSAYGPTLNLKKGLPGPFPDVAMALEAVQHCRRGVLRRQYGSLSCRHVRKNYKKIVPKLLEQTT